MVAIYMKILGNINNTGAKNADYKTTLNMSAERTLTAKPSSGAPVDKPDHQYSKHQQCEAGGLYQEPPEADNGWHPICRQSPV